MAGSGSFRTSGGCLVICKSLPLDTFLVSPTVFSIKIDHTEIRLQIISYLKWLGQVLLEASGGCLVVGQSLPLDTFLIPLTDFSTKTDQSDSKVPIKSGMYKVLF